MRLQSETTVFKFLRLSVYLVNINEVIWVLSSLEAVYLDIKISLDFNCGITSLRKL